MPYCNQCGTQIPEGANMCPACAARARGVAAPPVAAAGMSDEVAGALAYVTIIPAIVFLLIEPYSRNRFVRFHSFQCIFLAVAVFVLHIAISIVPFLWFLTFPLHGLISLGTLIVLVLCAVKANQKQWYKLPWIGDMAEKQANAI
jgi:uncharacterized membrane protein